MEKYLRKEYIPPEIEVTLIELEEVIAAGSANVKPQKSDGVVQEEWVDDDEDIRAFNW